MQPIWGNLYRRINTIDTTEVKIVIFLMILYTMDKKEARKMLKTPRGDSHILGKGVCIAQWEHDF